MGRMPMTPGVMMMLLAAPASPAPAAPLRWTVTGSDVTFEMTVRDLLTDVTKPKADFSLLSVFPGEEGFLMKDAKAVHAPSVHFSWEPPKPKKP